MRCMDIPWKQLVPCSVVELKLKLPRGQSKIGILDEVHYVPTLVHNILSVPIKVTEAGKTVKFGEIQGELIGSQGEIICIASKEVHVHVHYLNCKPFSQLVNSARHSRENLWHHRFGYLGERNLQMLKKVDLVKGFNYNVLKDVEFCESCVSGKLIALPFQSLVEKEQMRLMVLFIVNCEARSAHHHSAKLNT